MKRLLGFLLAAVMLLATIFTPFASAAEKIYYDGAWHTYEGNLFSLKVNSKTLDCTVPPIVFRDYSVVPARDVFEHLGAKVLWSASEEKVTVHYQETKIVMYINKTKVYKNNKLEHMPIPPKIINAKTMIPARYVAESLGFKVAFDSKTDTISIDAPKTEQTPVTPKPDTNTISLKSYSCTTTDSAFTAVFHFSESGFTHSSFALTEPDRIVVDIQKGKMGSGISNKGQDSAFVSAVRFGQQTDGLRVVFDTNGAQTFSVQKSGSKLTVTVGDTTAAKPEEKPAEKPTEEPEKPEIIIEPSRSITIDAGHGGSDPGACFTDEDGKIWKETDINLAIALKVRDILKKEGVRVVMTRTTEKDVVRKTRPELANSEKTALFLSIHTNSVDGNADANGIETWGSLETSKPLAGVTDKSFAQNVQNAVIDKTDARDRGIKNSVDLTVLKYSVMPSILIEVGFISNEKDRENMFTESYRNKLAQGIAEGVLKTFREMGV